MRIEQLTFAFESASSHRFFNQLSLTFDGPGLHFMQGDNGIGKSTLFSILSGRVNTTCLLQASVQIDEVMYHAQNNRLPEACTKQVQLVQQKYDLMLADQFTFFENLQLAQLPACPSLRPLPKPVIFDIIQLMSIDVHRPVHLLSGGQRQLLAILMALQKPTSVLLLDEPTATLDAHNANLIMQCLQRLAAQLAIVVIIICHDKELIARFAQGKRYCMRKVEDGSRVIEPEVLSSCAL